MTVRSRGSVGGARREGIARVRGARRRTARGPWWSVRREERVARVPRRCLTEGCRVVKREWRRVGRR
jgi:hypothetical protein